MTCFICPNGNGRMCSGGCGLGCPDCPAEAPGPKIVGFDLGTHRDYAVGCTSTAKGRTYARLPRTEGE